MRSWCSPARAAPRSATCATTPTPAPRPSPRRSPRPSSAPRSPRTATSRAPTRCSASPASRREAGEPEQLYRTDYGSGPRDAAGVLALAAEAGSARDRPRGADRHRHRARRRALDPGGALDAARRPCAGGRRGAGPIAVDDAPAAGPALRLDARRDLPLRVTNTGADADAAVVTAFGIPTQPEPAQGNGYRIERAATTRSTARRPIPPRSPLNDRLVAVVTVTPERDLQARLIVSDPLPAGLEIDNPNLLRSGETGQLAWLAADDVATHTEFRADRFVAAVDWQGAEPFTLAYMVRAVSPGDFHRPAASVEDMYRPAYRARTDAGTVTVAPAHDRRRPAALLAAALAARRRRRRRRRPLDRRDRPAAARARDLARSCSTATARCSPPTPSPTAAGACRSRLADVDRGYLAQLLAFEDRRFRRHPGVDPLALARAALQSAAPRPRRLRRLDPHDAGRAPARGRPDRHRRRQAPPDPRRPRARAAARQGRDPHASTSPSPPTAATSRACAPPASPSSARSRAA